MPPTPKKFEVAEAYWFGPVRPSVRPSVCNTCTRSRTVRDRILKFGMWDEYEKKTRIFSCPSDLSLQSYCPSKSFSFLLHCNPMEACEQNISRTA